MVNVGILLLVLVAVGLTLLIVALLIWAGFSAGTAEATIQACSDVIDPSHLIQIDPTWEHCATATPQGNLYYIGCTGNQDLDFVVSAVATNALDVCIGYCAPNSYTPPAAGAPGFGTCTGSDYKNTSAQDNFNTCMTQLNPTNCLAPVPLAAIGSTRYYAISPTCRLCGDTVCNCYTSNNCRAQCTPPT